MHLLDQWIITVTIFLPLAGTVMIACIDRRRHGTIRTIALTVALLSLGLAARITGTVLAAGPTGRYHQEQDVRLLGPPWVPATEIRYHVGIDGLSVFLFALVPLLLTLTILSSRTAVTERIKGYYALLLALGVSCMGAFAAVDLILFYLFFILTLILLYYLVGLWGGPERESAATHFFMYAFTGTLISFIVVLSLALQARALGVPVNFQIPQMIRLAQLGFISSPAQILLFVPLFIGFALMTPLFPLHTWLPHAYTQAPTAGSVFLAGILLKLGIYAFLRFGLPLFTAAALFWAPIGGGLAVMAILHGGLVAWAQTDAKRLLAWSALSQAGLCLLGIFTFRTTGLAGGVLGLLNSTLSLGALFLVVGMIQDRFRASSLAEIGGLQSTMPRLTLFAVLFACAVIGLPGLNGFVSQFMILVGAFTGSTDPIGRMDGPLSRIYGGVALAGMVLTAAYMLSFLRRLFLGPPRPPSAGPSPIRDIGLRETLVLTAPAVLVVLIGLWPNPVVNTITPVCDGLARTIRADVRSIPRQPGILVHQAPAGLMTPPTSCR